MSTREQLELEEARNTLRASFAEGLEETESGTPPEPEPTAPSDTDPIAQTDTTPDDTGENQPPEPEDKTTCPHCAEWESRYRTLQAATTKAQQQRSEFRKQNEALLAELRKKSEDHGINLDDDDLAAVQDVMPEVATALRKITEAQAKQNAEEVERRKAYEIQRLEETAKHTMAELNRQRPHAPQIAQDPAFWSWIDAHGDSAPYLREVLKAPWEQDLSETIAILDAYPGARTAAPYYPPVPQISSQAPPPPATAPTVQRRPSDVGVPVRSASAPSTKGTTPALSDSQVRELEMSLKKSGSNSQAIADRLRENMRLQAKR